VHALRLTTQGLSYKRRRFEPSTCLLEVRRVNCSDMYVEHLGCVASFVRMGLFECENGIVTDLGYFL
jgi:hypothetical protein